MWWTSSQIQLDSDFFLIIRENMLWTHWFILVEASPNFLITSLGFSSKYVVNSSFIHNFSNWFIWGFHENMWWTYSLIHCRIKQVQTCTANLIQKFFWLLLTYLESVCSCIWSSLPGKFTMDHQADNHQITVDLRLRIMQVPLTQMLSYCISVNSCCENY